MFQGKMYLEVISMKTIQNTSLNLLNEASKVLDQKEILSDNEISTTSKPWSRKMYAIAFDLDMDTLKKAYINDSYNNAYGDIKKILEAHGFDRQQGSVYFGDVEKVDAVKCVLAIMDLTQKHSWFASSVRDVRMLRIEDNNDLMPAVKKAINK